MLRGKTPLETKETNTKTFPKILYVIIIAILGLMYYYAAYIDTPEAEKTVQNFYNAYFEKDYETVAENLSVFWSIQFLPEYHNLSPAEIIADREKIEKDIALIISEIEKDTKYPADLKIVINPKLTKMTENSALVGYTFEEKGEASGMEVAILIKEKGAYRIYNLSPANPSDIENIDQKAMQTLDENFKNLLEQE